MSFCIVNTDKKPEPKPDPEPPDLRKELSCFTDQTPIKKSLIYNYKLKKWIIVKK